VAEAAAEQRLAALDRARREEREAAVRDALALGVRQASAKHSVLAPHACFPWRMSHVHLYNIQQAMPSNSHRACSLGAGMGCGAAVRTAHW